MIAGGRREEGQNTEEYARVKEVWKDCKIRFMELCKTEWTYAKQN